MTFFHLEKLKQNHSNRCHMGMKVVYMSILRYKGNCVYIAGVPLKYLR